MGKVICVLGMHRSGTSFLNGTLQRAGLYLGRHHRWNPHNRRGNRENPDIVALHDALLADNGGAWNQPPTTVVWSEHHKRAARRILVDFIAHRVWGFKDPRTLLVLDGWKVLLPELRFLGMFRHPMAVALSLQRRDGMPLEKAFALWQHYNARLLEELRRDPFPLLCFDQDEDALHERLRPALRAFGLIDLPRSRRFFSPELRHNRAASWDGVPPSCRELYDELSHFVDD